ncbi:hypothetical protein BDV93DRAFT_262948 [Ceratobasidium sp. AG-I]|nr:hypothetical protein BDV93DRAFT_262948 [Ceratobasidium sp. AG-I]
MICRRALIGCEFPIDILGFLIILLSRLFFPYSQALSCTECKRRKIKCDRQHPCGPCVRRTEADKCHWNVVEPADKYVLRTEWEALQHRVEALDKDRARSQQSESAVVKGNLRDGREELCQDFGRAQGHSTSQDLSQHGLDASSRRVVRLENFIASFAPEAWAHFQAEERGDFRRASIGADGRDRRDEERVGSRVQPPDRRLVALEDGHALVGSASTRVLPRAPTPRSESVLSLSSTRDDVAPQFQPLPHPPPAHIRSQASPFSYHSQPPPSQHQHQDYYARPLPPRGTSDPALTPAPSVSYFSGRSNQLDGPLPSPRSLGIVPGFDEPRSETSGSSRLAESWDKHLSSRVLPPPFPSPRTRASGASVSSTMFSEGRRLSDPNPPGKYDDIGSKHDATGSKHDGPDAKHDRQNNQGPQVFISLSMSNDIKGQTDLLASVLDKSEVALENGAVPDRTTCDLIIDHYFKRVAWNHNLIYPEAFFESYYAFFNTSLANQRAPFVALLLVVLCLGLGNMSPERAIRERICKDVAHWKHRCWALWLGCQRALGACNLARVKELEVVQTLIMLVYCNQSLNDNGWEHSAPFIGLGVRIAHSMGLSKLGSEVDGQIPPQGLRERELKRRVWWNLVFLDWYLSPFCGHTYLVHPSQCNTGLPANADWDELQDGKVFEPRGRKQWSGTAFLIAKSEVAKSVRELSDHINAGQMLTYEFMLAYEQRFNERLELIATALIRRDHILEQNEQVSWERIMFTFGLNNRAIRLHRRYMLRGYVVLEFRGSTETCISAAKTILHAFQEAQSTDFPGTTWWVVCMHSFAAAVILLMDQFYAKTAIGGELPTPAEMETRRRQIHQAIQLLLVIGEVTDLARRGAHVLGVLLEEVGRRRGPVDPLDTHPSPYTNLPPPAMGRLVSVSHAPLSAHLGNWVAAGLRLGPASVPDGELQAAPLGARGVSAEIEAFWTRVFELDFPAEMEPMP